MERTADVYEAFDDGRFDEWLGVRVQDLEFTTRLTNVLSDRGIYTVRDLYGVDVDRMIKWKQVGTRTVNEMRNWLRHYPDPRYDSEGQAIVTQGPKFEHGLRLVAEHAAAINRMLDTLSSPDAIELTIVAGRLRVSRRVV